VLRYANSPRRVIFLGMNPGPFGMAQTGVPFGEVSAARDWLRIRQSVGQPENPHPKRPVEGFDCPRSEVSGRRLWGLFADKFQTPERFFRDHIVLNYCPLAFMESSGKNRTPDKLSAEERDRLFQSCDAHLQRVADALRPAWVIGIGGFAFNRASEAFPNGGPRFGQVLHPSPACPAANRDWAGTVTRQMRELGLW
jgi:single-strand selective monofunctional uracil DNA glycosylase